MPVNINNAANDFIGNAEIERRQTIRTQSAKPQATQAERQQKFDQFLNKRQERHVESKRRLAVQSQDTVNDLAVGTFSAVDRGASRLLKRSKGAEKYKPETRHNAAVRRVAAFNARFKRN